MDLRKQLVELRAEAEFASDIIAVKRAVVRLVDVLLSEVTAQVAPQGEFAPKPCYTCGRPLDLMGHCGSRDCKVVAP
jgi:hypothetical protein